MSAPDLNLLRIFDVLLEERSVTKAGTRLGLSQSAVSHALNRLRHMLNDELFLRGPAGMKPTARALEIGARVHAAMVDLQAALAPADFEAGTTQRRFSLAAGNYAAAVLAPPLAERLAELAPQAQLAVTGYSDDLLDLMDSRALDFAVAGVTSAPPRFTQERLIAEDLVWAVSADSPLARRNAIDLATLAETPHVVVGKSAAVEEAPDRRGLVMRASWEDAGALELALAAQGLNRRVAVTVPDTYAALAVASRTDMATLVPRRLARTWAHAGRLKLIEPPYPSPQVDITLILLRDRLEEPPIAWMRELLHTVARDL
jgi:DNA-binding transcriptional LysR family regulator